MNALVWNVKKIILLLSWILVCVALIIRKKLGILFLMVLLLLTACSNRNSEQEARFSDYQRGFVKGWGSPIVETSDGYYFLVGESLFGEYLVFMDRELKESSFVCSKPECLHEKENDENKENCDAYFFRSKAVNYYNGKIYVLADGRVPDLVPRDAIYELELDGSNKKKIYDGEGKINSACIHRGDMILYEAKYIEGEKNPIVSITKFPVDNPSNLGVLYETNDYEDVSINFLECYQNYCYFSLDIMNEDGMESHSMIINLHTKKIKDCYKIANNRLIVGRDCLYACSLLNQDKEMEEWEHEHYECSLDGEKKRKLTEKDFEALGRGAEIIRADDQYVYLQDVDYGANAVTREEQMYYIYTYDGMLMGTVSNRNFSGLVEFLNGNDKHMFFKNLGSYYKIDKSQLGEGKELVPELILEF
ncbi:hypothetical protein NDGK_01106 [Clostridiales bacterium CHKCI001]|nr:hypothetical protein NDGK_01106 [Clostridiales bacterium CHKCI001]